MINTAGDPFVMFFEGHECTLTPCCRQEYQDCIFDAGLVEGHPVETVYVCLKRKTETMIFMRSDEMQALIWVMAGALWSEAQS